MSETRALVSQSFHYFYGNFFLIAAGFISFPILTRILTVNDYGILSYVSCLGTLSVAFSKLGLQHSAIRFFPDFRHKKATYPISVFYSTLYTAPAVVGGLLALLMIAAIAFDTRIFDAEISDFIALMAIGIPLRSAYTTFVQFLRAEQKVALFNAVSLIARYASLFLGIALVYFVTQDLYGLYYGGIICHVLVFLYATLYLYTKRDFSISDISLNFLKTAVAYGAPMAGYEFCSQILEYGDRILLKHFLGIEAVAIYTVGYSVPLYISQIFGTPLRLAVVPMYIDIWSRGGEQSTKQFIGRALSYFLLLVIPVIFGVCAIQRELVILLASEKYSSSYHIIPYIITGTMLYSTNSLLASGVFISKRTYLLALSLLAGTISNFSLNFLLIPFLGVEGAAISTLISYVIALAINVFLSFKYLKIEIDYSSVIKGFLAALCMFFFLRNMDFGNHLLNLAYKIPVGVVVYATLLMIIHGKLRHDVLGRIVKLRAHS